MYLGLPPLSFISLINRLLLPLLLGLFAAGDPALVTTTANATAALGHIFALGQRVLW